ASRRGGSAWRAECGSARRRGSCAPRAAWGRRRTWRRRRGAGARPRGRGCGIRRVRGCAGVAGCLRSYVVDGRGERGPPTAAASAAREEFLESVPIDDLPFLSALDQAAEDLDGRASVAHGTVARLVLDAEI